MATIHAEMNVIADCAHRGVSCKDATVYITHYPCINCMKLLAASQVNIIKYVNDYRNDELVGYISEKSGIEIKRIWENFFKVGKGKIVEVEGKLLKW